MRKLLLLCLLLSTSCQKKEPVDPCTHFEGWAMTMPYHVIVGKPLNAKERAHVSHRIQETFQEIDQTFNNWNPDSEISKLNQAPAKKPVALSQNLHQFLRFCDHIVSLSGGRFDPTIGTLEKVWKQALQEKKRPDPQELQVACDALGWNQIQFKEGLFQKEQEATSLDLCAVSKGLCIDWIVERLQAMGYADLFVEWAGEIRALGQHPEQRDWTVQIDPGLIQEGKPMAPIPLRNRAIATSGDYQQKGWTLPASNASDGQVHHYFHLIDPLTAQPLEKTPFSIAAVTVIAPTCALADALATAAMLFSCRKEAEKWAQEVVELHPEVSFWILGYQ